VRKDANAAVNTAADNR